MTADPASGRGGAPWRLLLAATLLTLVTLPTPATAQSPARPTITTQVVTSFDGQPLATTLFLPAGASRTAPVPLVLRTHGWAGTRETTVKGTLGVLLDQGYAVLTWDQRGFGCSGGVVRIDKPGAEGRDASALIDWAVANAPIATRDGDPLVAFTGGSYAGGIQTAAAAFDDRIDAIVPEISWYDLRYSLYAGGVVNQGWATALLGAGLPAAQLGGLDPTCAGVGTFGLQTGGLDPLIADAAVTGALTAGVAPAVVDFLGRSSLATYGQADPVTIPTLVVQGSVDTLFDLTDGWRIFNHVRQNGAPARFLIFCGGHVVCPASYAKADDRAHIDAAIVTWLDRWVRGDLSVDPGPPVEYRTNIATWQSADAYPPSRFGQLRATGAGALVSLPVLDLPSLSELQRDVTGLLTGRPPALPLFAAQPASRLETTLGQAFSVPVVRAADVPIDLVGIPRVRLTVRGSGRQVVLFAKLVDREAGEVVNLQEGPVRVALGRQPTTVDVPMPGIAYTLAPGHQLDLEVSTASLLHTNARLPSRVKVDVAAAVPAGLATPGRRAPRRR